MRNINKKMGHPFHSQVAICGINYIELELYRRISSHFFGYFYLEITEKLVNRLPEELQTRTVI